MPGRPVLVGTVAAILIFLVLPASLLVGVGG
jgi:hypothetical protein